LGLTEQEKKDLEAFLMSLTDARFVKKWHRHPELVSGSHSVYP
jgi:hypothetical protein